MGTELMTSRLVAVVEDVVAQNGSSKFKDLSRDELGRYTRVLQQDFLLVAYSFRHAESDYIEWLRNLPYPVYLLTRHWATVRRLALEAANHACALCPSSKRLNVHHRTYANVGQESLSDLTVLCRKCHSKHHGELP